MPHKLTHVMESFACFGIGWPRAKVANLVIWPAVAICAAVQYFGFKTGLEVAGGLLLGGAGIWLLSVFVGRFCKFGLGG